MISLSTADHFSPDFHGRGRGGGCLASQPQHEESSRRMHHHPTSTEDQPLERPPPKKNKRETEMPFVETNHPRAVHQTQSKTVC